MTSSSLYDLVIEEIPLYNVISSPDHYNSGNHGVNPDDYYKVLDQGNTKHWINSFQADYSVINIYDKDLQWMKEAFKSGSYTGLFPKIRLQARRHCVQQTESGSDCTVGVK